MMCTKGSEVVMSRKTIKYISTLNNTTANSFSEDHNHHKLYFKWNCEYCDIVIL